LNFSSAFGAGVVVENLFLYVYQSSNDVTVAWDKVPEATSYDLYLYHYEHKEKALAAKIPQPESGDSVSLKFKMPRSGHYELYVRAVLEPLSDAFKAEIDKKTTLAELKQLVHPDTNGGVCDAGVWWNDNATLADMKNAAKSQRGLCSKYVNSKDDGVVTQDDNTMKQQGWWLYAYPSSASNATITVE
jgi:hypothetical protein